MNMEFLKRRLQEIEEAIQNFIFQHHAAQGAKQEILNLMMKIGENVAEGVAKEVLENSVNDGLHQEGSMQVPDGA